MEMGNVSGRNEDAGTSGSKNEEELEEEEYMEYAHGEAQGSYHAHAPFSESMLQSPPHSPRAHRSPLMFTPQVPILPIRRPNEIMQIQRDELKETAAVLSEKGIPTVISWTHDGKQVAVEGSWDNWKTREFLQRSGREFSIIKVLISGYYHYRFIVDGQWRYAPDLPQERDGMGNVFNVLDLHDHIPEVPNSVPESASPPSPPSSYNNAPFIIEDNDKLPELPPLLQQMPLEQPPPKDSSETLQKPLCAVLNHLYIQQGEGSQQTVALSSTQRFRSKYVTVVLYKSLNQIPK